MQTSFPVAWFLAAGSSCRGKGKSVNSVLKTLFRSLGAGSGRCEESLRVWSAGLHWGGLLSVLRRM